MFSSKVDDECLALMRREPSTEIAGDLSPNAYIPAENRGSRFLVGLERPLNSGAFQSRMNPSTEAACLDVGRFARRRDSRVLCVRLQSHFALSSVHLRSRALDGCEPSESIPCQNCIDVAAAATGVSRVCLRGLDGLRGEVAFPRDLEGSLRCGPIFAEGKPPWSRVGVPHASTPRRMRSRCPMAGRASQDLSSRPRPYRRRLPGALGGRPGTRRHWRGQIAPIGPRRTGIVRSCVPAAVSRREAR
jgi:hypothetical protein